MLTRSSPAYVCASEETRTTSLSLSREHATVRGHRAWWVTFFDPRTLAWFTVVLDRQSLRTLELQMVTTAHFMHDVYGPFNEAQQLRPPT